MVKLPPKLKLLDKDLTGIIGEKFAANYLLSKHYQILYKRYTLPRWGELDIIAQKDNTIYFVEVKTSKSNLDPLDSITHYKIKHLQRSIEYYFCERGSKYINYSHIIKIIGIKLNQNNRLDKLEEFDLE